MFFAPPKVKSLSRYAEFGIYLGNQHFLMMLGVAITLHLGLIAIYSMTPRQEVIKIPVRALNIKLSGGSADNGVHMPPAASMPAAQASLQNQGAEAGIKAVSQNDIESALDKALADQEKPAAKVHPPRAATGKTASTEKPKPSEFTLATPKRYVREAGGHRRHSASGKGAAGNGSGVQGDAGGQEVIERYTQTVSQWIKNHQAYARSAYKEAAQGQSSVKGQAVIRLRIDRDGHILYNTVDRTSGNELVDQVASAMVQASDPLPAVPSDYPSDSQLEFLIAVQVDFAKQ
jgi:hypothetical protein